jgi:hypothetical protein
MSLFFGFFYSLLYDILYFVVSHFAPTVSDTPRKLTWALCANFKIIRNSDWENTHVLLPAVY